MTTENSSQETASSSASTSDTSSSSVSQSSPQTTPQSVSTPDAASASTGSVASSLDSSGNPVVSAPAYQPNFKFKAFGKEHEIGEDFRQFIKDKDTEEKFRKLHEKGYAMEKFQADEKRVKTEFDSYKTQTEPNMRAMNHFNTLLKNKDFENFFGGLGIPDEEVFGYVEKRLQLRNMPADQRAQFEQQAEVRKQNYAYESQLSEMQTKHQSLATETRTMQLDNILARPEVVSQASQIDRAYGEDGSFKKLVIEEAINHFNRTGEDLPADRAVQLAASKYGRFMQMQNNSAPSQMSQGMAPQTSNPQQAPIIPHVAGSARSPVKKQPKSLDDLKAMAKNL